MDAASIRPTLGVLCVLCGNSDISETAQIPTKNQIPPLASRGSKSQNPKNPSTNYLVFLIPGARDETATSAPL
jgi:hypothetical protein